MSRPSTPPSAAPGSPYRPSSPTSPFSAEATQSLPPCEPVSPALASSNCPPCEPVSPALSAPPGTSCEPFTLEPPCEPVSPPQPPQEIKVEEPPSYPMGPKLPSKEELLLAIEQIDAHMAELEIDIRHLERDPLRMKMPSPPKTCLESIPCVYPPEKDTFTVTEAVDRVLPIIVKSEPVKPIVFGVLFASDPWYTGESVAAIKSVKTLLKTQNMRRRLTELELSRTYKDLQEKWLVEVFTLFGIY